MITNYKLNYMATIYFSQRTILTHINCSSHIIRSIIFFTIYWLSRERINTLTHISLL